MSESLQSDALKKPVLFIIAIAMPGSISPQVRHFAVGLAKIIHYLHYGKDVGDFL